MKNRSILLIALVLFSLSIRPARAGLSASYSMDYPPTSPKAQLENADSGIEDHQADQEEFDSETSEDASEEASASVRMKGPIPKKSSREASVKPSKKTQKPSISKPEIKIEDLTVKTKTKKKYDLISYKAFEKIDGDKLVPSDYRAAWIAAGVPKKALYNAMSFLLNSHSKKIRNKENLVLIDFMKPSTDRRLFILNLKTGAMIKRYAAHGKNSGNLFATRFDDCMQARSYQTTPGFHAIGGVYVGKHGQSYYLDGLEKRNYAARERSVVIHSAAYATENFLKMRKKEGGYVRLGLSHGCPAVSPDTMDLLLDLKLNGSLLYNYTLLDSEDPNDPNLGATKATAQKSNKCSK